MTLAVLLLAASTWASAGAPPAALQAKEDQWAARGYRMKDRVEHAVDGLPVVAAVYGAEDGSGDRLEAYVVVKSSAYLGYTHPARTDLLELDSTPAGRGFHDYLHDGSRIIAYHATKRAFNSSSLELLRYKKFRFSRAASFPEGRFVQDEGETLILSRELPLGRFLSIGCESFGTISQSAYRTRLFAPERSRFVDVSARHPRLFDEEIARKEDALARLKGDLQKNAGEYLGLALSLYYDYAARGDARRGWERQKDFFSVPAGAPSSMRSCFASMRDDLRARLSIPADWP
jgi:hypothetical protein